jgi:amidohydrolase
MDIIVVRKEPGGNKMSEILKAAKSIEEYIVEFRRDIHAHPELSEQEFRTQKRIMEELDKLGIEYSKAGNTSIIATIKGKELGTIVALRGDIDALPIIEQSGVTYASEEAGIFHACGHDAHMSMLLGAARILKEKTNQFKGEVRFFFQEGEETFSGARKIIAAGGMDGVSYIMGMHGLPTMPTGTYDISEGYRLSGTDTIYVKFEGVSGHGSAPHLAKDTIHPACIFVTDLQGIVTKNIDPQQPVVLSVGRFSGGTKANVISKFTEIDISMRSFDRKARETVHEAIRRHAAAIAAAYEITVEVEIEDSAISLYNEEEMATKARLSAEKVFGPGKSKNQPRLMASEDFSYYLEMAKGVYAFLGFRNEDKGCVYFPHNEKFKIDEDYMIYGTALYAQFALDMLEQQ